MSSGNDKEKENDAELRSISFVKFDTIYQRRTFSFWMLLGVRICIVMSRLDGKNGKRCVCDLFEKKRSLAIERSTKYVICLNRTCL